MRAWTVANQKGGVGKTTSALALASLLAARGQRVLLVDLDPHASLGHLLGVPQDPPPRGVFELFDEPPPAPDTLLREVLPGRLWLLAAQPALATLEKRSASRSGMGQVLARAMEALAPRFDHALFDCPPTLGVLMVNALAACDRLIVPTQTEPLAVQGLAGMVRTASMIERSRGRPLPVDILPTLHDRRPRVAQEALDAILASHTGRVFDGVIPMDTRLREAGHLLAGDPAGTRGLAAYASALDWILARDATPLAMEPAA